MCLTFSSKLNPNEESGENMAWGYGIIKTTITATTTTYIIAITTAAIIYWLLSVSQFANHLMHIVSFITVTGQNSIEQEGKEMVTEKLSNMS